MERPPGGRPGVLVDRDGTLIRNVGYLSRLEQMEILPLVPAALRLLRRHGLKVAVITNQSAVARGLLTEAGLLQIHRELERRLRAHGAFLDAIYYCPHHPTEGIQPYRISCECRKPEVAMARRAAADLDLDLGRCYVIGDQLSDMEFAARLGARGILIQDEKAESRGPREAEECLPVRNLWEAAGRTVQDLQKKG